MACPLARSPVPPMTPRRAFLRWSSLGAAAAALAPTGSGTALGATVRDVDAGMAGPWALLDPVRPGDEVGFGWRAAHLAPVREGAAVLTLVHAPSGRAARVDLCLRRGLPRGPAASRSVDFVVMDGAKGRSPTEESLGRVVRRLAALADEAEGRCAEIVARLLPHSGRVFIPRAGPAAAPPVADRQG